MFKCWLSGHCCSTFDKQVSAQEFEEMQAAGPMLSELNLTEYADGMKIIHGRCPWLNEDNTCSIYEKRPSMCRNYLCFRGAPAVPFRTYEEQKEFIESSPEAQEQAREIKRTAMEYARYHGWPEEALGYSG